MAVVAAYLTCLQDRNDIVMQQWQPQQQLALAAEVTAARAFLEAHGSTTHPLNTPGPSNCQYVLASTPTTVAGQQRSALPTAPTPSQAGMQVDSSTDHQQQYMSAQDVPPPDVVVPVSARSGQLSMATMAQLLQGVPAALGSLQHATPAAAAAGCTAAGGTDGGGVAVGGPAGPAGKWSGDIVGSATTRSCISLTIVDGVDVAQLKLFTGIQAPSESY